MKIRYLLIIPCFLLIVIIKMSGSLGLADVESLKARASIKQWQNDSQSFNTDDWDKVYSYVKAALENDPNNPDLLSLMGNVYEWNTFNSNEQPYNNQNRKRALDYYRKAVELRPQWPYAWSDIALLKYRMAEFDQEFQMALSNATQLGPWEPNVQKIITEVGLNAWDKLEHSQRITIVENIKRGITMEPQMMLDTLKKYDQLRLVCHEKNKQLAVERYCDRNFGA